MKLTDDQKAAMEKCLENSFAAKMNMFKLLVDTPDLLLFMIEFNDMTTSFKLKNIIISKTYLPKQSVSGPVSSDSTPVLAEVFPSKELVIPIPDKSMNILADRISLFIQTSAIKQPAKRISVSNLKRLFFLALSRIHNNSFVYDLMRHNQRVCTENQSGGVAPNRNDKGVHL